MRGRVADKGGEWGGRVAEMGCERGGTLNSKTSQHHESTSV
jgi:hypothetical protein